MRIIRLTNDTIQELVSEKKSVPAGLTSPHKGMTVRNGHYQKSYEVICPSGNEFVIKLRQTVVNPLNFSVILGYRLPGSFSVFRLRRYNSKHIHTNVLENEQFHDFHIHLATERYQKAGFHEDAYAERTQDHWDFASAIERLLNDCGFASPFSDTPLFKGIE